MKVIVLGAGVIGTTTAYALARQGHRVTVIDRASAVAAETSHANGAQLSYSYTDPMATPNMLMRLPALLFGADPAFQIGQPFSMDLIRWGLCFMRNCTPGRVHRNLAALTALAQRSARSFEDVLARGDLTLNQVQRGKLILVQSERSFEAGRARAKEKQALGLSQQILDGHECQQVEPMLQDWRHPIAGGFYAEGDATVDALSFTRDLARHCFEKLGVRFQLATEARDLILRNDQVVGVDTDKGDYLADACVVCLGPNAARFLRRHGVALNMYPIKGYSVTMPASAKRLRVSLTDLERKLVFANLGDKVRLAGLSDFVGRSLDLDQRRVSYLVKTARGALPSAANFDRVCQPWAGLRPAMPDGLPVIGPTRQRGLFLNVGHGMLGWTLAMGSADRLVQSFKSV